jgi:hypothetical protein
MPDWPKAGDSFFGAGSWKAEGVLGAFVEHDGYYYYAAAYKEAGDELVQAVLDDRLQADSAVYPVLYLYRHYVELILKDIVGIGAKLEKSGAASPGHHIVRDLWQNEVRPLLERTFPEGKKEDTDIVEKCVLELASIDASGEASRYPTKKKGGDPTWPKTEQLNLDNMRQVMKRIATFLDGSSEAMADLLQSQADIDADMASERSD